MSAFALRFRVWTCGLAALLALPALAQSDPHAGHRGMQSVPNSPAPGAATPVHEGHDHGVGPAGATYDLRFIDGMLLHRGGALVMAHDALANSSNPTVRRFARSVIVAQRAEIMDLRRMLALEGLHKSEYHQHDALFAL